MHQPIRGIHHVTAIAGDPQANIDFYTGPLGLRLVKQTVNFDEPGTWHLYYGDARGTPGSALTFFPFPGARRGHVGSGQVVETAFAIPRASLGFWIERLQRAGVETDAPQSRSEGETALRLRDPDGLPLALVTVPEGSAERMQPWPAAGLPERHAIRGFHGLRLAVAGPQSSRRLLADTLGLRSEAGDAHAASGADADAAADVPATDSTSLERFRAADGGPGAILDLVSDRAIARGRPGAGTVHHLALRVRDEEDQLAWRERVAASLPQVTPVADRQYFRSIYFREPGGILFELATDGPGFEIDEALARLGQALRLPPWYASQREQIEARLPDIRIPEPAAAARELLERLAAEGGEGSSDLDVASVATVDGRRGQPDTVQSE